MRRVVVLPAPLGPRNPKIEPASTRRSTPATASTTSSFLPKVRRSASVTMTGSLMVGLFVRELHGCPSFRRGPLPVLPARVTVAAAHMLRYHSSAQCRY